MAKDEKKDSFVFYRGFYESILDLPDEDQLILFRSICAYGLDQREPDFSELTSNRYLKAIFAGFKPQMDVNHKRFINGCKGGAKAGNQNARKQPKTTKAQPNENENENENENSSSFAPGGAEKEKIFSIFFFDKNFLRPEREVERFWNYYSGNGWKWGEGRQIADIEAVARQWKGESEEKRFDREFLDWYQMVFQCVSKGDCTIQPQQLTHQLVSATRAGKKLDLIFRTEQIAAAVSDFVSKNNLSSGFDIRWRYSNPNS